MNKEQRERLDKKLKVLPNGGRATTKTIYNKKIPIGKSDGYSVNVVLTIEETDLSTEVIFDGLGRILRKSNTKQNVNLEKVSKYYKVSFVANSRHFGGQCQDYLFQDCEDIYKPEELQHVIDLWNKHHSNDMNAGTLRQQMCLKKMEGKYEYDKVCQFLKDNGLHVDRGYEYGTQWLVNELTEKDILYIIEVFERLKQ